MSISSKSYTVVEGIDLFYTDSGPPTNASDYTTLVAVHGFGFPGVSFEGVQSHAREYNLRVVAVNRRDYAGSTPYSDEELAALTGKDESRAQEFFNREGLYLSLFLKRLIEEERIPEISANRKTGGIALLGWSQGVLTAILPLTAREVMGEDTYSVLERYVKDFILYDPPYTSLGLPIPEEIELKKLYTPWTDPTVKVFGEDGVFDRFIPWVGSRYNYTIKDDMATYDSIEKAASLHRSDQCIADALNSTEIARLTDSGPAQRADIAVVAWGTIIATNAQKVLFPSRLSMPDAFPNLSITYIYAPHSTWLTVLAVTETKKEYERRKRTEEIVRPIRFLELEGSDHFVHYTHPQYFLKVVKDSVYVT